MPHRELGILSCARMAESRAGLVAAAAVCAAATCGGHERALGAADSAPAVELSGCKALRSGPSGPVCELAGDRRLRAWIAGRAGAPVSIVAESTAGPPAVIAVVREAGLTELEIPANATRLVARGAGESAGGWSAALRPFERPAAVARALELLDAGDTASATEGLQRALASAAGSSRAPLLGALARVELAEGRLDAAVASFRAAVAADLEHGRVSEAVDDALALSFALATRAHRYSEAREALEVAERHAESYPDGRARLPYYRAILARRVGDLRGALEGLREAEERAWRLGLKELANHARHQIALAYESIGRYGDAVAILSELRRRARDANACDASALATAEGWGALLAADDAAARAEAVPAGDLLGPLEEALALIDRGCRDAHRRANALLNLALAHLQRGEVETARRELRDSRAAAGAAGGALALWWMEVEARIELAAGRPRGALALFEEEARLAQGALAADMEWRAEIGRARALVALGQRPSALAAFQRASALLERQSLAIPLGEGRGVFLGERERSASAHIDLLLEMGRAPDAMDEARRSRRRMLGSIHRLSPEQIDAAARAGWDEAVGRYRRQRDAIEREAALDWAAPKDRFEALLAARREREEKAKADLDRALGARSLSGGRASAGLKRPGPSEAFLCWHPLERGWAVFAATSEGVEAHRIPAPRTSDAREELAALLLRPVRAAIEGAQRVVLMPHRTLEDLDLHALPFNGAPLVARRAVAWSLDLEGAEGAEGAEGKPASGVAPELDALVAADPEGDLLAARTEAREVVQALSAAGWKVRRLEGRELTAEALGAGLPRAKLFHFSGHGVSAGRDGWGSALPLASSGRWTLGDTLALPAAPERVALFGCETGRAPGDGAGGFSLAHAFLSAGSREVVAAAREVADPIALDMARRFYREALRPDAPPAAEALQRAQVAAWRDDPGGGWRSFRAFAR